VGLETFWDGKWEWDREIMEKLASGCLGLYPINNNKTVAMRHALMHFSIALCCAAFSQF
jgi:hypothetical protein